MPRTLLLFSAALALTLSACQPRMSDAVTAPTLSLDAGALDANATIVANAAGQPELSSLVGAVQRAGLVDALNGDGPFTVFAPINAAFEDIDAASLSIEELQSLLQYHVVAGRYMAGELVAGTRLETLGGAEISVSADAGDPLELNVDDADIIYPNIEASNGVIHLINVVLTPEPGGQGR